MKDTIYRPQVRLHYDRPEEREIIEKIQSRNKALHNSVNDYVVHAIYAFEANRPQGENGASGESARQVQDAEAEIRPAEKEKPLDDDIAAFLNDNF